MNELTTREARRILWLKRRARDQRDFERACKLAVRYMMASNWAFASEPGRDLDLYPWPPYSGRVH